MGTGDASVPLCVSKAVLSQVLLGRHCCPKHQKKLLDDIRPCLVHAGRILACAPDALVNALAADPASLVDTTVRILLFARIHRVIY